VVTSFSRSALASHADIVLVAGGRDVGFRLEAMLSRLAHLAVIDGLYLAVAERLGRASERALDASAAVTATHTI
jgi:RpiR family transcriptional regulator, carbohydrate utilization regulator